MSDTIKELNKQKKELELKREVIIKSIKELEEHDANVIEYMELLKLDNVKNYLELQKYIQTINGKLFQNELELMKEQEHINYQNNLHK